MCRVIWEEPTVPVVDRLLNERVTEDQRIYLEASLARYRFVLDYVARNIPQGGRVLDLGCSPGYTSICLHWLGYRVYGVDMGEHYQSIYPDPKWPRRLRVVVANLERADLPFSSHFFDAVVFTEVLEHIGVTHPRTGLKRICEVLKPSGSLVLTTPNVCNLSNILALLTGKNIFWKPELFYDRGTDRHNREFTPEEVRKLVYDSGFQVVEQFLFNSHNNWNSATAEAIYRLWPSFVGKQDPAFGNTIFIAAQASPAS